MSERLRDTQLDYLIFDIATRCKDKDGGTIHMRECLSGLRELQERRMAETGALPSTVGANDA